MLLSSGEMQVRKDGVLGILRISIVLEVSPHKLCAMLLLSIKYKSDHE